ncbi:cobyric acid synthase CobQ, partial [Vibrio makurazakiensis]
IIPGSKSVRADLEYLRSQGWEQDIQRHLRLGGKVMGICGGYQILGKLIDDPDGVEGTQGQSQGLDLLNVNTVLTNEKTLTNSRGHLTLNNRTVPVSGYEIHVGKTNTTSSSPIQLDTNTADGALSDCNQIFGTYLHGIFDSPQAFELICEWAGAERVAKIDHQQLKEDGINRIADAIEEHLDLNLLWPELSKQ